MLCMFNTTVIKSNFHTHLISKPYQFFNYNSYHSQAYYNFEIETKFGEEIYDSYEVAL